MLRRRKVAKYRNLILQPALMVMIFTDKEIMKNPGDHENLRSFLSILRNKKDRL